MTLLLLLLGCEPGPPPLPADPAAALAACGAPEPFPNSCQGELLERAGAAAAALGPAKAAAESARWGVPKHPAWAEVWWASFFHAADVLDPASCPDAACRTGAVAEVATLLQAAMKEQGEAFCPSPALPARITESAWARGEAEARVAAECTRRAQGGRCPEGMVPVPTFGPSVCVEPYEARLDHATTKGAPAPQGIHHASAAGQLPSEHVSYRQAKGICERAGRHLCTAAEFQDICDGQPGPGGRPYAWGWYYRGDICPLNFKPSPQAHVYAAGSWPGCVTPEGVYDLVGNLWEWVDPQLPEGVPPKAGKMGSSFYSGADRVRCDVKVDTSHPLDWEGSIGFRCCAPPTP